MDVFNLPQNFYQELLNQLNSEISSLRRRSPQRVNTGTHIPIAIDYPNTVIPSLENLQTFIETIFWASIKFEEAKRSEFIVGYYDVSYGEPSTTYSSVRPPLTISSFLSTIQFNSSLITKLSTALENPNTGLCVGLNEEKLNILGISSNISTLPLKVKVIDPGELIVSFNNRPIAKISGTNSFIIRNPHSYMDSRIWSILNPNADNNNCENWADARILVLLRILHKMRNLGHGGAIILHTGDPNNLQPGNPNNLQQIDIQYRFTENIDLANVVGDLQNSMNRANDQRGFIQPGYNYPLDQYLQVENCARSVASLTAVDGATLLNQQINVIGFGVKLLSRTENIEVFNFDLLSQSQTPTIRSIQEMGGTRHQSAVRFIRDLAQYNLEHNILNNDAIVFVVSQDRVITAFTKGDDPSIVNAYKNLDITLA